MFTRWLNLHMLSSHPGPDSDDSWEFVDLGVWTFGMYDSVQTVQTR